MATRPLRAHEPIGAGALAGRTALCLVLLALGFLAVATDPAEWVFRQVALAIAAAAELILGLLGNPVLREGIVLRHTGTDSAVAVTAACDGHGLLIPLAAALLAFPVVGRRAGWLLLGIPLAFLAIELFNAARVAILFGIDPQNASAFERAHYIAFPIASAIFLALIAASMLPARFRGPATRRLLVAGALCVPLTAGWMLAGEDIARAILVPVAKFWLALIGPEMSGGFATEGGTLVATTHLVTGRNPIRHLTLPLRPADFALALPLVLAMAALLWRRPAALIAMLAAALALTSLAFALGTVVQLHKAAIASDLTDMILPGMLERRASYHPPGTIAMAFLAAAQNAIVHFNLLVLPFLAPVALTATGRRAIAVALAPGASK